MPVVGSVGECLVLHVLHAICRNVMTFGGPTSGEGLHELKKGSVRAVITSEGYLSDVEARLHNMHMHDKVFITKKDEQV